VRLRLLLAIREQLDGQVAQGRAEEVRHAAHLEAGGIVPGDRRALERVPVLLAGALDGTELALKFALFTCVAAVAVVSGMHVRPMATLMSPSPHGALLSTLMFAPSWHWSSPAPPGAPAPRLMHWHWQMFFCDADTGSGPLHEPSSTFEQVSSSVQPRSLSEHRPVQPEER
jgi:hypothetical protein